MIIIKRFSFASRHRRWRSLGAALVAALAPVAVAAAEPPAVTDGKSLAVNLPDAADRQVIERLVGDMVVIPAGAYEMGDTLDIGEDDESPVHTVTLPEFALNRYEVTFEQYDVYAKATGREAPEDRWGRGRRPVIDITWEEATAFAGWLAQVTGLPFRLPTEAEWEYAARAGTNSRYSFGDDAARICEYANVADSSTQIGWRTTACSDNFGTTAPVGSFKPNGYGLYDMHGNVWEWLQDCWSRNYRRAPEDGSARTRSRCDKRVQRGGSWFYGPEEARVSYRTHGKEDEKSVTQGFRVAMDR